MVPSEESLRAFGDRYRLLEFVGEGSSARVYLAEDLTLHRRVALKILRVETADDESFRECFAEEMRATSALNHPRVLPVHDWGLDPQPYSVSEYLAGGSLAALLGAGHRLTPSQALVVGLEAARALVNIHAGGRAHLGLAPTSILFDSGARPYVSDLGLSAALAVTASHLAGTGDADALEGIEVVAERADEAHSESGEGAGTNEPVAPPYRSDEQGSVPRSYSMIEQAQDVHDLALVLREAVTGVRVPRVGGEDAAAASMRALGPLQAVLERAIAADPRRTVERRGPGRGTAQSRGASPPSRSDSSRGRAQAPCGFAPSALRSNRRLHADRSLGVGTLGGTARRCPPPPLAGNSPGRGSGPRRRGRRDLGLVRERLRHHRGARYGRSDTCRRGGRRGRSGLGSRRDTGARAGHKPAGRWCVPSPPRAPLWARARRWKSSCHWESPLIPLLDLDVLYGMTVQDATDELEARGLAAGGETLVNDAVVPPGLVVGIDVGRGRLRAGGWRRGGSAGV